MQFSGEKKPQTLVVMIMMTQIEDDVFIVFLWSNLNFRIVPDAWLGLCVNCVFSYISEVF